MTSANVTRYALTLGDADTTTGWYAKNFSETTIKMVIRPRGGSIITTGIGLYAQHDITGFSADAVLVGDEIKDSNNNYYTVKNVQEEWYLDSFSHYVSELTKRDFGEQPTTSGTWHLDSESAKTDPRYRHKSYLDTYLTAGNLLEDNGSTQATTATCFDSSPYPIYNVLITKGIDLTFCIGVGESTPRETYDHHIYAFDISVPITIYAVNKTGLTATNLIEQGEQEINRIITTYPLGSIRRIQTTKHAPITVGGAKIYSTTVTIHYTRANDDFTPTYPTFGYGIGFTYEGDRLSGGAEGTWTLTEGGSTVTQTINNENNLYISLSAFVGDAYTTNGTNLGLSTTIYTKIRFRYKTSGNTTAKIIATFSDATTQTILSETASTTMTVGNVSLTTAKTLDHITLYACDGVGTAHYDYVHVYTDTYIIPNVTIMTKPLIVTDAVIDVPLRVGEIRQPLGCRGIEIRMTCDLDMEPAAVTWKRPQTATPKTDYNNIDILLETAHLGSFQAQNLWTWLDLGTPNMQFKARLVEINPSYTGELNKIELVWREYRHGSAANETTSERFGLSL